MSSTTAAFTVGVLADTHIPDRVVDLHPDILPTFQQAGVCRILHAGDISTHSVLDTLARVAPVTAVRGNRDLLAGPLKMTETVELGGVRIALTHGHGGWGPYLWDKWKFWAYGYQLERYRAFLLRAGADAQVVVFGHTHFPENSWHDGRLLFNPGSASFGYHRGELPAVGLLHIGPGGWIRAERIPLAGWQQERRRWVPIG